MSMKEYYCEAIETILAEEHNGTDLEDLSQYQQMQVEKKAHQMAIDRYADEIDAVRDRWWADLAESCDKFRDDRNFREEGLL